MQTGTLSPESVNCLIETLDPFHDTNYSYVGLPDSRNDHSVVQCVKKTITIKKPAGLPAGDWDVHICSLPERNHYPSGGGVAALCTATTLNEDGLAFDMASWSAVEPNIAIAPLVWTAVPSGNKTWPTSVTDVPVASITRGVVDLNDYFAGNSRIIGGGFEIHNVTNKLQVKGTCTVYRLPQTYTDSSMGYFDRYTKTIGAYINYWPQPHYTVISRLPPATADEALLLPHSKQWNAEFGSYQVFTTDFEKQPSTTQFGQRHFGYYDFAGGQSAGVSGDGSQLLPGVTWGVSRGIAGDQIAAAPPGTKNTVSVCAPFKLWPADTTGCFYTGLGDETTLTLTAIFIIETFPTQPSPLVTLATPPPSYDPMFFKIYKDAALLLPPGVMVGENASGDWWETVIDTVADVASSFIPGGKMVLSPLAKIVKGGINGIQAHKAKGKNPPPAKTPPGKGKSERTKLAEQKAKTAAKNASRENTLYKADPKGGAS